MGHDIRHKPPGVRVNVKLVPRAERERSVQAMSDLPGVWSVIQTFPEETDADLSGLYLLEIDASYLASVLQRLRQYPGIEYAEEAAARKLIR